MRPTLRQLEYIVTVAEKGRIGLAAQELNVSQPSLSAQLSEVEQDLGVRLFHRGRAGAVLTAAGERLVKHARTIIHAHQDMRAAVVGAGIFGGHLRLGVLPSIGPYLLPRVVQKLHQLHPDFRLIIREESTVDLDAGLRDGRFDMIISTPEDHVGMQAIPLFREDLWVALAHDHPLSATSGRSLPLRDLANQTFLTLGTRHRLSHIVAGLAIKAGGRVSSEYEGTSLDAVRLMAATGAGIAVLPAIYALAGGQWLGEVQLCMLADKAASRDIALISPGGQEPDDEDAVLATILKEAATAILTTGKIRPSQKA